MLTKDHVRGLFARGLRCVIAAVVVGSASLTAQAPAGPVARLSAATANLNGGPDSIRIDVLAWSTDAVRNQMVDAWKMIAPAPGTVAGLTEG